jgi:hypothetical protein
LALDRLAPWLFGAAAVGLGATLLWLIPLAVEQPGGLRVWRAVLPPLGFTLVVFFAKPGHVLAYLPGAVLLALLPGSRAAGRARLGLTVAVLAVCAFSVQRFVGGEGVVPDRLVSSTTGLLPAPPGRIEVPPGGSAVFVLDRPTAELVALGGEGRAERRPQPGLSEVWVVRPGARLFGVEVVSRDGR